MIEALILSSLAVFGIWEAYLSSPLPKFEWLSPLLVAALSVAWCWPDWRLGTSVLGVVGILHVATRDRIGTQRGVPVRLPSRS